MSLQIPISSVMYPPRLFPSAEGSVVFNIPGVFCVMRALIGSVLAKAQIFFFETEAQIPVKRKFFPILKKFLTGFLVRFYIILKLHLLKFALTKKKIAWGNFVPESFSYLPYAERQFRMH